MANFKVEDYFRFSTVSPTNLTPGQIIQFDYSSSHDTRPLVYVYEKRVDRFFGVNLHYDMNPFTEVLLNQQTNITNFLEKEYTKVQENRDKLLKENIKFTKDLITEEQYNKYMRLYSQTDLALFEIKNPSMKNMRQYLYSKMTAVSKLVYKV